MQLVIASLRTADRKIRASNADHIISIGHPNGEQHCSTFLDRYMLRLGMHDALPASSRRRTLPQADHVYRALNFVNERDVKTLLVHCKAGKSRSTSIALACLASRGVSEEDAIKTLLEVAPRSTPNGWILCLADMFLNTRLFVAARDAGIVKWK